MRQSDRRRTFIAACVVASVAAVAACSSASESGECGDFDFSSTRLGSRYRLVGADAGRAGTLVFDRNTGVAVRTTTEDGGTVVERWVVGAAAPR